MGNILYTIGYSGFEIKEFIETLKKYKINVLVDVRSNPYSSYYVDYDKNNIEPLLNKNGIYYRNYKKEFGARQVMHKYYVNGVLDFDLFVESDNFKLGFEKISKTIDDGYVPVLMCAEKDPINCHRAIMVSRQFFNAGYDVLHIMPDDTIKTQNDIQDELIKLIDKGHGIPRLGETEDQFINRAYRQKNMEIGYKEEDLIK